MKHQPKSSKRANAILLVLSIIFALALGEGLLRLFIFSDTFSEQALKLLGRFIGDIYADDSRYRLQHRLKLKGREDEPVFSSFHPLLGWTARPITEDNPLGITKDAPYALDSLYREQVMLFFGDSFTLGLTDMNDKIPQLLDDKLSEMTVLNFGVAGYGLDQMYLYLKTVGDFFSDAHVMIGLFYNDIDRCVYKIREAPKPYFEVEAGELVLKGTPLPDHYGKWLEVYPLPRQSYFLTISMGLLRRQFKRRWASEHLFQFHPSETQRKREEKTIITRLLIEKIKKEIDLKGWKLTFVLFPYNIHLIKEGWYERYLHNILLTNNIDYIDMKKPLNKYMNNEMLQWYEVYSNNNHPTEKENQLMSDFIADHLRQKYGYPHRSESEGNTP